MRFREVRGLRVASGALLVGALAAWLGGCNENTLGPLGSPLRVPPDSLRTLTLRHLAYDSVYTVPVSTGRSAVAQVGQIPPYRAHMLYDFKVQTRTINGADTLRLDTATLDIHTDSILVAPFTGSIRLRLQEVAVQDRWWALPESIDAPLLHLPALEPGLIARDTLIAGSDLANHVLRLAFDVDLAAIAGFDSVRAQGGVLDLNVALLFQGFDRPGKGFLRYTHVDSKGAQAAQVNGFAAGEVTAMTTANAVARRIVAEFDSTYSTRGKLVVSDGYRLHTYFKFPNLRSVLPDSALVYGAELVLTQTDSLSGVNFGGSTDKLGIIIPTDRGSLFFTSKLVNTRPPSFTGPLTIGPRTQTTISVTPYFLGQQEGSSRNRGMILVLPGEGTEVRQFEFYGTTAPDSLALPALRIIYGFPAGFEGGHH